ncbi:hypothetical protein ACIBHY_49385 [Nonomuraea sp. NPDC050547]|uniref:hypothetical protein n=1 Tax=Nonomuraea sp. NPDC050547 TaxID=3364368 RepID=UPI0037999E0E
MRTGAEFMSGLRRLKAWSGRSYREIQARAQRAGHALPYSTAAGMLKRETLPREQVVEAFARGCGLGAEQASAWVAARKRVATQVAPTPEAEAAPVLVAEPVRTPEAEPVRARPSRRRRWVAAVLVAAGLVGVTATVTTTGAVTPGAAQQEETDVQEIEP